MEMRINWHSKEDEFVSDIKAREHNRPLWGNPKRRVYRKDKEESRKSPLKRKEKHVIKNLDDCIKVIEQRRRQDQPKQGKTTTRNGVKRFGEVSQRPAQQPTIKNMPKIIYPSKEHHRQSHLSQEYSQILTTKEKQLAQRAKMKRQEDEETLKVKLAAEQAKMERLRQAQEVHRRNLEIQKNNYIKSLNEKEALKRKRMEEKAACIIQAVEKKVEQKRGPINPNLLKQAKEIIESIFVEATQEVHIKTKKARQEVSETAQRHHDPIARQIAAQISSEIKDENMHLERTREEVYRQDQRRLVANYKDQMLKKKQKDRQAFEDQKKQKLETKELKKCDTLTKFTADEIIKQEDLDKKKKLAEKFFRYKKGFLEELEHQERRK